MTNDITKTTAPNGVFAGKNFMTPSYVCCLKTEINGRTVYIEVSEENRPYWEEMVEGKPHREARPMVGLTYRHADGSSLNPDPSTCVRGFEEASEVLGVDLP